MSPLAIRAHFDGEHIRLDEPCQLEPDAKLLIIVLPEQPHNGEHEDWTRLSLQALENAYGQQEPEYSLDAIKEPNPDYGSYLVRDLRVQRANQHEESL